MPEELWRIEPGALDEKLGTQVLRQSPERAVATMPVMQATPAGR